MIRISNCRNCDKPTESPFEVCDECYRDPETNKCEKCGKHSYVAYPFICGDCFRSDQKPQ